MTGQILCLTLFPLLVKPDGHSPRVPTRRPAVFHHVSLNFRQSQSGAEKSLQSCSSFNKEMLVVDKNRQNDSFLWLRACSSFLFLPQIKQLTPASFSQRTLIGPVIFRPAESDLERELLKRHPGEFSLEISAATDGYTFGALLCFQRCFLFFFLSCAGAVLNDSSFTHGGAQLLTSCLCLWLFFFFLLGL